MQISKPLLWYGLIQIPGYLFLGILLYMAWSSNLLEAKTAGVLMGLWVFKDILLYPLYRPALQGSTPTGAQALVGAEARACTDIQSRGQVVIRGERWQASSGDGSLIPAGTRVRVVSASGLTLSVEPLNGAVRGEG